MECDEEEGSLRIRRSGDDGLKRPPNFFYSDPEWIAKQLAFTTKRKEVKIYDLIRNIKNEFDKGQTNKQMDEITYFIEQLGDMITTDPRLGDLLDMDFLRLLLLFLKHDRYPNLQAYTATILKPLVIYSCNDEDVVVVIRSCTPIVANLLIRCKDSMVQVELKLVVPALIKLIESDLLTPLTSGCRALALLCDGREEMVVEDADLDCLIGRLVNLMNSVGRAMVISALNEKYCKMG